MIEIDGSQGEGGGQIVRTATALAAVTGTPIRIVKIRKNRPQPGLKPQHLKTLETLARITEAKVEGLELSSTQITFKPHRIRGGSYNLDIGTAGSITLALQCLMLAATRAEGPMHLKIRGGTDVAWSPPIDYLINVTLPVLRKMGYRGEVKLIQRGYYPRGGGVVEAILHPASLKPLDLSLPLAGDKITGISHASNLPTVARRQARAAENLLRKAGCQPEITIEEHNLPSTGSGITLWQGSLGANSLGARGKPAEKVGKEAAQNLLREIKSKATADIRLTDQLIPYMALAGSGALKTREITLHTETNIQVTGQLLEKTFQITHQNGLFQIQTQ